MANVDRKATKQEISHSANSKFLLWRLRCSLVNTVWLLEWQHVALNAAGFQGWTLSKIKQEIRQLDAIKSAQHSCQAWERGWTSEFDHLR